MKSIETDYLQIPLPLDAIEQYNKRGLYAAAIFKTQAAFLVFFFKGTHPNQNQPK